MRCPLLLLIPTVLIGALGCSDISPTAVRGPHAAGRPRADAANQMSAHWTLLAPASAYPGAGFTTTTYAPDQNAVFVATAPDYAVGTVARFDLTTDSWSIIPTSNWPIGKFRRVVYNPIHHALITYWDGIGEVYAVSTHGGAWQRYGDNTDSDEYYEGGSFFDPVRGQVASFAGYGLYRWKNTLWEIGPTTQWALVPTAQPAPWPRIAPSVAVDAHHQRLFITGGQGSSSGDQYAPDARFLNDLWSLDLNTLTWSNLIPLNDGPARSGSALAYVPPLDALVRFGGTDSLRAQTNSLETASLGFAPTSFEPVAVSGLAPGPRTAGGLYYDAPRNRLVYLGGNDGSVWIPDVWAIQLGAH